MKALTLWPEWIPAILHLGKHVENRTWRPNIPTPFELALHAGATVGGGGSAWYRSEAIAGVIFTAEDAGWVHHTPDGLEDPPETLTRDGVVFPVTGIRFPILSSIVAIVTVSGVDEEERTPWDSPLQYHWRLTNIRALPTPVPCRGAQGLWTVPGPVEAAVLAALGGVS